MDSRIESQAIFNEVVRHLALQKRRAANEGGGNMCSYRTWDGLACAVGCLFVDDEYAVAFEGKPVSRLVRDGVLPERLKAHAHLLIQLQLAHDDSKDLVALKRQLKLIALNSSLDSSRVSEIKEWEY